MQSYQQISYRDRLKVVVNRSHQPPYLSNKGWEAVPVERFRGGPVFKAQRFLYHSTPGSRVIKKKEKAVPGMYRRAFLERDPEERFPICV